MSRFLPVPSRKAEDVSDLCTPPLKTSCSSGELIAPQVSLVNFWADYVWIYLKQSFSGQILDDVGLPRPPAQDRENSGNSVSENLSLELIPQMDGDVIFLMPGGQN